MRVLVLGASGFIGRRLVRALQASDFALPIAASRAAAFEQFGIRTLRFDATNHEAMAAALQNADAVVNCIAGDSNSIINSALALFAAAPQCRVPPRIVNLSTMMVYGTTRGRVSEEADLPGDWDDYSAAKLQVEHIAAAYPRVVHLRPGIVYGPNSPLWTAQIARWLCQGRLGELGAGGRGICNLVHVDDVLAAVFHALQDAGLEGRAYNLSLPSPPTWNEYFRAFAGALKTPLRTIAPGRLKAEQWLIAPPLKMAQLAAARFAPRWKLPEPIRPWLLRLCVHPLTLDVSRAESELKMHWRALQSGLEESAEWFRSNEAERL